MSSLMPLGQKAEPSGATRRPQRPGVQGQPGPPRTLGARGKLATRPPVSKTPLGGVGRSPGGRKESATKLMWSPALCTRNGPHGLSHPQPHLRVREGAWPGMSANGVTERVCACPREGSVSVVYASARVRGAACRTRTCT